MTQTNDATRSLVLERMLPHPPEKVWRALTETSLLDEWLMKSDFQAIAGHKFHFRAEPNPYWDGIVDGEVLAVEPPKRLAYRWEALGLKTVVTWTLTASPQGTFLRMEQAGFAPDQARAYGGANSGWSRNLDALESLLARA